MTETHKTPRALIASAREEWRVSCAGKLLHAGFDVHTADTGLRAIDDLRKHRFAAVIMDDSLEDLSPFEMHLNVQDLAHNGPSEFIALEQDDEKIRRRLQSNGKDILVGSPDEVFSRLSSLAARESQSAN